MLQNRNLSVNDKKRLLLLATREIERANTSLEPKEEGRKNEGTKEDVKKNIPTKHAPKDTASFLSLFNNQSGFKYLTHNFDHPDLYMEYDQLLTMVRKVFKEATSQYIIPYHLYGLMYTFLYGGKDADGNVRTWKDCDGMPHKENYASKSWKEWADQNPKLHPLVNKDFEKTILKFRSSIRLLKPELTTIVKRQESKHPNLNIISEKIENAEFYTYVWDLEDGIRRILDDMSRYANTVPNVRISFERKFREDFSLRIIKITQIGSTSSPLEDAINKFKNGGGDFVGIKNTLFGYCNWSVESIWDGNAKRWNILEDNGLPEIEDIEVPSVMGFTHILTYYSK